LSPRVGPEIHALHFIGSHLGFAFIDSPSAGGGSARSGALDGGAAAGFMSDLILVGIIIRGVPSALAIFVRHDTPVDEV
jgi:hypothetical protein